MSALGELDRPGVLRALVLTGSAAGLVAVAARVGSSALRGGGRVTDAVVHGGLVFLPGLAGTLLAVALAVWCGRLAVGRVQKRYEVDLLDEMMGAGTVTEPDAGDDEWRAEFWADSGPTPGGGRRRGTPAT
ncbi:MAG: hypothetical protein LBI33_11705, partial [Propionibacteriaceae bacterium]|nr:hypothetical protein [Propionibacteriaceae bacterium]